MKRNSTQRGERVLSFRRYGGNGGKSLEIYFELFFSLCVFISTLRNLPP